MNGPEISVIRSLYAGTPKCVSSASTSRTSSARVTSPKAGVETIGLTVRRTVNTGREWSPTARLSAAPRLSRAGARGSASGGIGDRPQGGDAWHEQVLAATRDDQRSQRGEQERPLALDRHLAADTTEQEVAVGTEVKEVSVVEPLALNAFELPGNARVEAHEHQAAI